MFLVFVYHLRPVSNNQQVALLTNPIWVAKTRMQLQAMQAGASASAAAASAAAAPPPHASTAGTLLRIVREEGFWGLYRGIRPSLLLVSHGAIQFAVRSPAHFAMTPLLLVASCALAPSSAN